ncbi:signal peptidase I [Streptococcus macacae]|uniref:Signal peptidase I n=1 Tax=Streptococcus macacae NCTC 11558 TaxID=764298 RepID=G5JXH7_9STRE|nr:signal peptidase I [Streptococcus macacae]EHJ52693.1 signal peptidase I [Streptococcus macacae NCTC 11558]SUN79250.1 signal peptidase I [Streptococcus macacae NCTC 11558]
MKNFLKEWGIFILFIAALILSRIFVWAPVRVEGHSMDPTLADKEQIIIVKTTSIKNFDIVVAKEGKKNIVKRVVGMPGDTISFNNDTLSINGKKVDETYLKSFKKKFAKDKLQKTYSYNNYFQQLAASSAAFTTDSQGKANFTVTVPKGQYFLLGDDRIVSKDSRQVGTFSRNKIIGEVKFRFWPLKAIKFISNK